MASRTIAASADDSEFSLVLGGPVYQLLFRTHMLQPPTGLVHRRILASILITWIVPAGLSLLEGTFYGGTEVPFLLDLGNLRFLVTLPILIGAEVIVHRRIRTVVEQFIERGVVAIEDREKYQSVVRKALRLRNSVIVELLIAFLSYTGGHWLWNEYGSLRIATWYAVPSDGAVQLSWAGTWYAFVSLPLIRFFLLRWFFRLFIWYLFLWRVSRFPLILNALHPDRAGGLGFLNTSAVALTPVMIAQSCFLSAQIGNEILYAGKTLPQFQIIIVGFILFLIALTLVPLTFFAPLLIETKLKFVRKYGTLASEYVRAFTEKWLAEKKPAESLLGASDIQSLADLSNSFDVVREMRMVSFDKLLVLRLFIALALPLMPLLATMFSSREIAERLIKLLI